MATATPHAPAVSTPTPPAPPPPVLPLPRKNGSPLSARRRKAAVATVPEGTVATPGGRKNGSPLSARRRTTYARWAELIARLTQAREAAAELLNDVPRRAEVLVASDYPMSYAELVDDARFVWQLLGMALGRIEAEAPIVVDRLAEELIAAGNDGTAGA